MNVLDAQRAPSRPSTSGRQDAGDERLMMWRWKCMLLNRRHGVEREGVFAAATAKQAAAVAREQWKRPAAAIVVVRERPAGE